MVCSIAVTLDQNLRKLLGILPDRLERFPKMYFKVWSQNKTWKGGDFILSVASSHEIPGVSQRGEEFYKRVGPGGYQGNEAGETSQSEIPGCPSSSSSLKERPWPKRSSKIQAGWFESYLRVPVTSKECKETAFSSINLAHDIKSWRCAVWPE